MTTYREKISADIELALAEERAAAPPGEKLSMWNLLGQMIGVVSAHTGTARDQLAALADRVAALEAKVADGLQYEGVHEPDRAYRRNLAVTHDGSIWISMRETRQRPGDGADWKLAVKRGKDAR